MSFSDFLSVRRFFHSRAGSRVVAEKCTGAKRLSAGNRRIAARFLPILLFPMLLFSCSIDYSIPSVSESDKPEFIFKNASFSRTEGGRVKAVVYADEIELYRSEDCMYGSGISFVVYNADGNLSVAGSCGLFSADTSKEQYYFYDEVNLTSYEQDMRVEADNINWNGKTEQLVSAGVAPVRIYSGGFSGSSSGSGTSSVTAELTGMGFSADGNRLEYVFLDGVSGTIYTQE
jgi:hypothetical protein